MQIPLPDPAAAAIPPAFSRLPLRPSGFIDSVGPFYGRRDGDSIVIGLRIEARHCNSAGHAHGGMLMAMVDVVLTVGANFNAGTCRFLPTVHASCDFIRAVPLGTWVEGHLEVLRVTGSHVFSQLRLCDQAGDILVRGSGVLLLRGDPDPAEFGRDRLLPLASTPHPPHS